MEAHLILMIMLSLTELALKVIIITKSPMSSIIHLLEADIRTRSTVHMWTIQIQRVRRAIDRAHWDRLRGVIVVLVLRNLPIELKIYKMINMLTKIKCKC